MIRQIHIVALLLVNLYSKSQNTVISRVSPSDNNTINIKWYFTELIHVDGFNIYRKESEGTNWQKVNATRVKFKSYKITEEAIAKDKELKGYLDLVSDPANIKDFAFIAVLIKSFKSEEFSKYIGIWYDDTTGLPGRIYEYKISRVNSDGTESILGKSEKITQGNYIPIMCPQNINFNPGNKKVSFKWDPEPNRYFGVNIYRKTGDTGSVLKLTKEPIILSKNKNKSGEETYGEEFYVDQKLSCNVTYRYFFEAVDFFGSPSVRSNAIKVILKDRDPPAAPDSIYNQLLGRKATIKWKKKNKESDLAGYNVYRTNKNDTDFAKINRRLIPVSDSSYTDSVSSFGTYMYAVSSIDKENNESVSNPYFIDVFDNEPPVKPQNVIIQADSGRLFLKWSKNPDPDLKGYLIYRTINKDSEDTYVKITPDPIKENSYTDLLEKNIKNKFLYKIVAVDESMNRSVYSDFAIASMPDVVAPSPPFIKKVSFDEKKHVKIEWIPNVEADLEGYNIYRKNTADGTEFKKLNSKLIDKIQHRYTDRNTVDSKEIIYEYFLEAVDSSQNISKQSNHYKLKVKFFEKQSDIVVLSFTGKYIKKNTKVELNWTVSDDKHLKGYIVYKLNPYDTEFSPITGIISERSVYDTEISENKKYSYQVRAYNEKGDVFNSEKITLKID